MTPARSRGKYICINHAGLIVGMATAFWVGYALDHWETAQGVYYGWRLAVCLQYIPAFLFLAGAYWTPET
jgi:multisubunit Na+/H+ antiporter MnhE subunit